MQEFLLIFFKLLIMRTKHTKKKRKVKKSYFAVMSHNGKYYKKTLKRNAVMSRNIASMLQPNVLRANDSSNTVLNNNQVLYNNPTSVAETNSSEKEITNAENYQKSRSNDSQSETLQIFENLNSIENVSEPELY